MRRGGNVDNRSFVQKALTVIGLVIGAVVLVMALWLTRRVWLLCFAAVLLAILLRTTAQWVSARTGLSTRWSLVCAMVCVVGLLVLGGVLISEPLSQQITQLSKDLPKSVEHVRNSLEQRGWMDWLPEQLRAADFSSGAAGVLSRVSRMFSNTFEAVASLLLIVFLALYLAASPETYIAGITRLFPVPVRPKVTAVMSELGETLWHWLVGQIVAMVVVGTLVGIGLAVIGVPMFLALGILAGLLEFIPFLGPLIAATPAVLLAFTENPMHALYVVLLFVGINFIEGHFLLPLVNRYSVKLPPALTLISLVVMGSLFGFLGMLLATPLAALMLVLIRRVYVEDVLEHRSS